MNRRSGRRITAAVIFSAAVIVLLLLLALGIWKDSDRMQKEHPGAEDPLSGLLDSEADISGQIPDSETENVDVSLLSEDAGAAVAESSASEDDTVPAHSIIFVGDSRTVGCGKAIEKLEPSDSCLFVGKVGEGCAWFVSEGMDEMGAAIESRPDAPVVLNFGVNDPDQIEQYISAYRTMLKRYPRTEFRFLSVNPVEAEKMAENGVSEDLLSLITNESIRKLNDALRSEWPDKYLDSSSMLYEEGFETVDGIHYSEETYLRIHDYTALQLFS